MSLLPMGLIYFMSNFFYFLIYNVFKYRRKVVLNNVRNSFPNHSELEQKKIVKDFYHYLTNLVAESIKNLSISENDLLNRMQLKDNALMDQLYKEGKNVIILSSHLNNWELLITAQSLLFKHQAIGIGTPLSNKFWDAKINERRERFGMQVVHANNYKEILQNNGAKPTATLVLGDQSPGKDENCYWTDFLNQKTAFFFGAEILANQFNSVVVYASIKQLKKGHYEVDVLPITLKPHEEDYGFITSSYIELLEKDINASPANWLWSHKRWKKSVPKNLQELQKNHEKRFVQKFRS